MPKGSGRVKVEASSYQIPLLIFCSEGLYIGAFGASGISTNIAVMFYLGNDASTKVWG
jgi:hypothetical protein